MSARSYHHGDLRNAVLEAAVAAIGEVGPAALSLRDLARRAGVSHAAPAHHFGDKAGVLGAVAAQGFDLLAEVLSASSGDLRAVGAAYVGFAVDHRAHFEVMFRPELYRVDDPEVRAARDRASQVLYDGIGAELEDSPDGDASKRAAIAAWSFTHGFATLWLTGALPDWVGDDATNAARDIGSAFTLET
ncbi:TetR/AcrR family transcriptional regulator [Nocardioidaceae bacterium SCSIO 66511]|nr:TetR/AcrR family transcriptional regulator [Nocardioidaceae bacterium SCSIO 66511]